MLDAAAAAETANRATAAPTLNIFDFIFVSLLFDLSFLANAKSA